MTEFFFVYHDTIVLDPSFQKNSNVHYVKLNRKIPNAYDSSVINLIEQPAEYQHLQPDCSEFTAFKMMTDQDLIRGDWVVTLQYDHKVNAAIIGDIGRIDSILVFSPYGNGVRAAYEQQYTLGRKRNVMDWILDWYNEAFPGEFRYEMLEGIPLPMCSAVKVRAEAFRRIVSWVFAHDRAGIEKLGSNISRYPRWVGMVYERMFAVAVAFEIARGQEYRLYPLEHHS